jgi:hypothetical protein
MKKCFTNGCKGDGGEFHVTVVGKDESLEVDLCRRCAFKKFGKIAGTVPPPEEERRLSKNSRRQQI